MDDITMLILAGLVLAIMIGCIISIVLACRMEMAKGDENASSQKAKTKGKKTPELSNTSASPSFGAKKSTDKRLSLTQIQKGLMQYEQTLKEMSGTKLGRISVSLLQAVITNRKIVDDILQREKYDRVWKDKLIRQIIEEEETEVFLQIEKAGSLIELGLEKKLDLQDFVKCYGSQVARATTKIIESNNSLQRVIDV